MHSHDRVHGRRRIRSVLRCRASPERGRVPAAGATTTRRPTWISGNTTATTRTRPPRSLRTRRPRRDWIYSPRTPCSGGWSATGCCPPPSSQRRGRARRRAARARGRGLPLQGARRGRLEGRVNHVGEHLSEIQSRDRVTRPTPPGVSLRLRRHAYSIGLGRASSAQPAPMCGYRPTRGIALAHG